MKKINAFKLSPLVIVISTLMMVGCSNNDNSGSTTPPTNQPVEPPVEPPVELPLKAAEGFQNRAPLAEIPYLALPMGAVKADGWLLKQLEMQRDGITGNFEELASVIPNDEKRLAGGATNADSDQYETKKSGWLGGEGEVWERSPYYLRGLVALAYTLDDEGLKKKAQKWIEWTLNSQQASGEFGPPREYNAWWPRMIMMKVLIDYYEATEDDRVIPFLTKFTKYELDALDTMPLTGWAQARGADNMSAVLWLYNKTGDDYLLELIEKLKGQTTDWISGFKQGRAAVTHGVNIAQGFKMPAVYFQKSKDQGDKDAYWTGNDGIMAGNGQIIGSPAADEPLAGKGSTRGVETCSVVERMYSDEISLRVFGDARLGDRLEKMAYNSLPANYNKDLTGHTYFQSPNQPIAAYGDLDYSNDHGDDNMPGPVTGFPCCAHNNHMGWPYFVQNMWAATDDGGLAVMAYGPSYLTAKVGEKTVGEERKAVTIREKTGYPFKDTVSFTIETTSDVEFPLELRIPGWSKNTKITVNGVVVDDDAIEPATFYPIDRVWSNGDKVEVQFAMEVKTSRWINGSMGVERGPLVYSLKMDYNQTVDNKNYPDYPVENFNQSRFEPKDADRWNYAFLLEDDSPESSFTVDTDDEMPVNPYDPASTPVRLTVPAQQLLQWTMKKPLIPNEPPVSPVQSGSSVETITLIPFGATNIRMTYFPVIGEKEPEVPFSDNFDDGNADGWTNYGGTWSAESKAYKAEPGNGPRSVLTGKSFSDFTLTTKIRRTAESAADAGVVFRSNGHGVGGDAYNGYYAGIGDGYVVLGKSTGGWSELERNNSFAADTDTWYNLKIVADGPLIKVFVGDKEYISYTDTTYSTGNIGLRNWISASEYDDITVTPKEIPAN